MRFYRLLNRSQITQILPGEERILLKLYSYQKKKIKNFQKISEVIIQAASGM